MPDFSVPVSLLKRPIDFMVNSSVGVVKDYLLKSKVQSKVGGLHKKLWDLQRIKTIWNPDKAIALNSIYHPVSISFSVDGQNVYRTVSGVDSLNFPRCLLVGTVGQGKSILLRFLLGKEIRSGDRVPLFFELRNYSGGDFEGELSRKFCDFLGVDFRVGVFESFCVSGKVSLLLDGLDEVASDCVHELLSCIEVMALKYPFLKIIISARPDSGGEHLSHFSSVKIQPLARDVLPEFFKKITKDDAFSKRLNGALVSSPRGVAELISTPLSATLVAIIYRSVGKIPEHFSDFYDELFKVLVSRHDASKLGWTRQRKSGLTDRQLQQAFEAFCFQVRRRKVYSCSVDDSLVWASEGLAVSSIVAQPDKFIGDIQKVTCLIVREGRKIEFVHASVANYFSAKFIKYLPHEPAMRFYEHLLNGNWKHWVSEIDFLKDFDSPRINEGFIIPDMSRALELISNREMASAFASNLMTSSSLVLDASSGKDVFYVNEKFSPSSYSARNLSREVFNSLFIASFPGCVPWNQSELVASMSPGDTVDWFSVCQSRGNAAFQGVVDRLMVVSSGFSGTLLDLESSVKEGKDVASIFTI